MHKGLISGLPLFKHGNVRDIYDLGDHLLIVASDRISCFDVTLPTEISGKGEIMSGPLIQQAIREKAALRDVIIPIDRQVEPVF